MVPTPWLRSIRNVAGVVVKDLPRYLLAMLYGGSRYLAICNRNERLLAAPNGLGYQCDWRWTSELHAPKVFPKLGKWLMRRTLSTHRIPVLQARPDCEASAVRVSFIIGHRGMARLPHLQATLRSIAGQCDASVECIVVEQDVESRLRPHMPEWVRLVHTPPPSPEMPYCRSWAFNVGAAHAKGSVLVLHDNDLLVSDDYANRILGCIDSGYEVVNLKRYLFYLSQAHTEAFFLGRANLLTYPPENILQNAEGGGSIAISRDGFEAIGGMDESFVGWGGEDNEFWERAHTLRVWPWANLPIVHLWHAAQPGKRDAQYHTARHYRLLAEIDPSERIRQLKAVPQGNMAGPLGWPLMRGIDQ